MLRGLDRVLPRERLAPRPATKWASTPAVGAIRSLLESWEHPASREPTATGSSSPSACRRYVGGECYGECHWAVVFLGGSSTSTTRSRAREALLLRTAMHLNSTILSHAFYASPSRAAPTWRRGASVEGVGSRQPSR